MGFYMDLSDFIQPLVIEKSEDFKPREAKVRFEKMCQILSRQAFWLSLFEYLEKHKDSVSGVKFDMEYQYISDGVAEMMEPVAIAEADAKKFEKAVKAAVGAFSKARGKISSLGVYGLARMARETLPSDGIATLERKEQIFKNALGAELYGLRLSIFEHRELDSVISNSMAQALGGRSKPRL